MFWLLKANMDKELWMLRPFNRAATTLRQTAQLCPSQLCDSASLSILGTFSGHKRTFAIDAVAKAVGRQSGPSVNRTRTEGISSLH